MTFLSEMDRINAEARETLARAEALLSEMEARDAALSEPLICIGCGEQFAPRANAVDPDLCDLCGVDYLSWLDAQAEAERERHGEGYYPTPSIFFGEPL